MRCVLTPARRSPPAPRARQVPLLDREVRGKDDIENYSRFLTAPPTKEQLVLIADGEPW